MNQNTDVLMWQEAFAAHLERQGACRLTIAAYMQDLGRFGEWFAAENRCEFNPELLIGVDLRAYRHYSLEFEKVKPATWNRRRATLSRLAGWARKSKLITYDVLEGVLPAEEVHNIRWLSTDKYRSLMRTLEINCNGASTIVWQAQAVRDQAMVLLMVQAGLREGEVCGLDCGDVSLGERKGKVVVRLGKRGKRREIPLGNEARRGLALWLAVRQGEADEPLFGGKNSERLTTRTVQRRVKEIGRQAGINDLTPHMLRHTFAKRLLDVSQLTVVQNLMGHARISTTARYVMPGWEDMEAAVAAMR